MRFLIPRSVGMTGEFKYYVNKKIPCDLAEDSLKLCIKNTVTI